jgi:hypothetical protein
MKLLRRVGACGIFTAAMLSHTVHAALIDADWMNLNDNLLTTDTDSHLSWLDLTQTAGMSRNDVLAATDAGGMFDGFRYATADEVIDLWSQYGITLIPATRVTANSLDDNIITAAQQLGNVYGLEIATSDYGTLGLIEVDSNTPATTSGWAGAFRQSGQSFYEGPTISQLGNMQSEAWLGSYLVTTVPVPPAVWLFASGLLGLMGVARQRK